MPSDLAAAVGVEVGVAAGDGVTSGVGDSVGAAVGVDVPSGGGATVGDGDGDGDGDRAVGVVAASGVAAGTPAEGGDPSSSPGHPASSKPRRAVARTQRLMHRG